MKELIRKQLALSLATLQAVHDDEALHETLTRMGQVTAEALAGGHKLLVAGNGGSAADAQHLVAEFVVRLTVARPAMRAIALTVDSSILTAAGNDLGYDQVFARQIEALGQNGDVLLVLSTSGKSPNILAALETARQLGLHTLALTGSSGRAMLALCDHAIVVPSSVTMKIQETHLVLEHIFCMLVERSLFGLHADSGIAEAGK